MEPRASQVWNHHVGGHGMAVPAVVPPAGSVPGTMSCMASEPRDGAKDSISTAPLSEDERRTLLSREEPRLAVAVYHRRGVDIALLRPGCAVVVGRKHPSDLCIDDPTLSRQHARFTQVDTQVMVEDLGSTNGTWIAGQRVPQAALSVGAEAMLGSLIARIQMQGAIHDDGIPDGENSFRARLDDEIARTRHFQRRLALLAVRAASRAGPAPVASWVGVVRSHLRPIDRMGLYSDDTVLILLPEMELDAVLALARTIALPGAAGDPVRRVGVALYPQIANTSEELIERARAMLAHAGDDEPVQVASPAAWVESKLQAEPEPIVAGAAMRSLLETVQRVANARIPVVLHGETGTGKEVVAHLLHERSPRRQQRMVRVNCGAIPGHLVESTLFGHEKGAFTGAVHQQKGVFEEADGGTVFLDEIGELLAPAQAALLRVLETGHFCRVGSAREIAVDVRIIAATHRDLEAMANEGVFRADLLYRLNAITLAIPPLRQRFDELEPLAMRFVAQANQANGRAVRGISRRTMDVLRAYDWPGNVRELRNAIERAVVVTASEMIEPCDLPSRVHAYRGKTALDQATAKLAALPNAAEASLAPPADNEFRSRIQQYEARIIAEALAASGWSRATAARRLGMPLRTLAHKIKIFGIKESGR